MAIAFLFGANVGSFLNVVIARVPYGESVVWPPSHCRSCGKAIPPLSNIPILAWFLLRGRCESCLAKFSFRYAFVELLYACACAFAVYRHGVSLGALHEMALTAWLICLSAIDLDHWLLPHELTRSGIVVGLLLALGGGKDHFLWHLFGAAVGFTGLLLIAFIAERIAGQEALGGGDPWLMGMLGAFLGVEALFPILLLASIQGSLIGAVMIAFRRRREAALAASSPAATEASAEAEDEPAPPETDARDAVMVDEDEEDWVPPPTGVPFGPFLALGGLEVHYFEKVRDVFVFWW